MRVNLYLATMDTTEFGFQFAEARTFQAGDFASNAGSIDVASSRAPRLPIAYPTSRFKVSALRLGTAMGRRKQTAVIGRQSRKELSRPPRRLLQD
jgi:hypothetical protein